MLQRIVAAVFGFSLAATAAVMLFAPRAWYDVFPGVLETGPFNPHFVRDLGCAFIAVAGVLLVHAVARRPPISALIAMAVFIALHALVHIGELFAMSGARAGHAVLRDLPSVYLPAILLIWFAVAAMRRDRRCA